MGSWQPDYERDIVIDESSLDVEFCDQPHLFIRYAQKEQEARRDADYAKERLDIKKAELDWDIRSDPEKYNIGRITEAVVQNTIQMDPDYQVVEKEFLEARYEAGMAAAAVRAFDQRKVALENLARLHGQQYFAGPRVPRDLTEERQKRQETSNRRVGMAMRRRRSD